MRVPFFIAFRYLTAKKTHNVIGLISLLSSIGMAVGTAALVVIMSVYNGFDSIVKGMMSTFESDLVIEPVHGKKFIPQGDVYDWMYDCPDIATYTYTVTENVFLSYDGAQTIVKAKGIDSIYAEEFPIAGKVVRGSFFLWKGQVPYACVGAGVASSLGINPAFLSAMRLYYPDASSNISLTNPESSLRSERCYPSSIFSVNADIDRETILLPVETMQALLGYSPSEFSAVEIRLADVPAKEYDKVLRRVKAGISERLDPKEFRVLTRTEQNPALYRMMRYEKAAIYLILIFVIIVIAFNIFGSLSMLIIDKKDDIATLSSLGMPPAQIRRIFTLEGWMVSVCGLVCGLAAGLLLAWIQLTFGLVKMPGSFTVSAYPVVISLGDILLTSCIIAAIGYFISLVASRKVHPVR